MYKSVTDTDQTPMNLSAIPANSLSIRFWRRAHSDVLTTGPQATIWEPTYPEVNILTTIIWLVTKSKCQKILQKLKKWQRAPWQRDLIRSEPIIRP